MPGADGSIIIDTSIDSSGLKEGLAKLAESISDGMEKSLRAAADVFEDAGNGAQKMSDALKSAGDAMDDASRSIDGAGDTAEKAGDEIEEAGKKADKSGDDASSGGGKWEKFGSIMASVGKIALEALGAATGAAVGFAKASVETGAEFDAAMSKVGAISGSSGDELDALRDKAREMGSETVFSASEAAEAMNYMAMAGWEAGDMLDGIEGIMNLAAASGESLGTTSDIVTDALTAFGLAAEDSAHFADVLASASASANTNVGMMGETFKYVAPVAGALNYSAEDIAVAVGLMANSGIKASQAGTTLRAALTSLVKPSDDAMDVLGKLGLVELAEGAEDFVADLTQLEDEMRAVDEKTEALAKAQAKYQEVVAKEGESSDKAAEALKKVEKATYNLQKAEKKLQAGKDEQMREQYEYTTLLQNSDGSMKDFSETVETLRAAFAGLDEATQAEYAATIFGQRAMSGMLAIINSTDEDLSKLTTEISRSSMSMDEITQSVQDSGVAWEKYTGNFDGIDTLVDEMVTKLTEAGMSAEELAEHLNTEYDIDIADAIAAVEAVQVAMDDSTGAAERMAKTMTDNLAGDITIFKSALSDAQIELSDQLTPSLREFVQFGTSALQDLTTAFKEGGLDGAMEALGGILSDALSMIVESLPGFLDAGMQLLGALGQGILDNLPAITQAALDVITELTMRLLEALPQIVEAGVEIISMLVVGIGEALPTLIPAIVEAIVLIAKALIDNLPTLVDALFVLMEGLVVGLIDAIPVLIEALPDLINSVVQAIVKLSPVLIDGCVKLVLAIVENLPHIISALVDALPDIIVAIVQGLIALGKEALSPAGLELTLQIVAGLIEGIAQIAEACFEIGAALMAGIIELIPGMKGAGKDVLEGIVSGMREAMASLHEFIQGVVESVVGWFKDLFGIHSPSTLMRDTIGKNLMEGLADGIKAFISKVTDAAKQIPGKIRDGIQSMWNTITGVGKNIIGGIADGLKNAFTTIVDAAKSLPAKIWEGIQSMWSSVTNIGKNLISGITDGLTGAFDTLKDGAKNAADTITGTFKNLFGIHSPSKLMRDQIGKNLALGIAEGLEDGEDSIYATLDDIADAMGDKNIFDRLNAAFEGAQEKINFDRSPRGSASVDDRPEDTGKDKRDDERERPMMVDAHIEIDGREFARVVTPAISKELAWEGV